MQPLASFPFIDTVFDFIVEGSYVCCVVSVVDSVMERTPTLRGCRGIGDGIRRNGSAGVRLRGDAVEVLSGEIPRPSSALLEAAAGGCPSEKKSALVGEPSGPPARCLDGYDKRSAMVQMASLWAASPASAA